MPASTRIGPYRVLRLINRGGQGGVFLGYDDRLRRRVAIKVHRLPQDRAGRNRLVREARIIASIDSPKVVHIYDLVLGQDNVALIMEYVPGCDLEEFLRDTRPSVSSVLTVATDLAGSLTAARQHHVVHGDLKARNVLVTDSGRVKLTDFGIARSGGEHSVDFPFAGSPDCISPEQYLGESLDVRSDLFALGCLLYRMLSGEKPFVKDGRLDSGALLGEMPPAIEGFAKDLPPGLSELVTGLLQKKPDDRPHDTQQVRYALRTIARTIPLSVSSTLLHEAKPSFREEAPGDVPPAIPVDLKRRARSRLRPFQMDEISSWKRLFTQIGTFRLAALFVSLLLVVVFSLRHFFPDEVLIFIERPVVQVATGFDLPPDVSAEWLVDQVKKAAESRLGEIVVAGPVGATVSHTLYTSPPNRKPREQLSIALRCSSSFCVFAVSRREGSKHDSEQVILFPDMPISGWTQSIQSAARVLYDRNF